MPWCRGQPSVRLLPLCPLTSAPPAALVPAAAAVRAFCRVVVLLPGAPPCRPEPGGASASGRGFSVPSVCPEHVGTVRCAMDPMIKRQGDRLQKRLSVSGRSIRM